VLKQSNIYDLVEREAVRSGVPRLELWQSVAKALVDGRLPASSDVVPLNNWLGGFKASVDRYNEPNAGTARHLTQIFVHPSDFKEWRRHEFASRARGPRQNTTGYQASDRKLFPRMKKLMATGQARSSFSAALMLADEIAPQKGTSTPESKAKRVSALFRKENP
jgi:hypothetical protein